MNLYPKTRKYNQLIEMYSLMANNGYKRNDGIFIPKENVYSDLEPIKFKNLLKELFLENEITEILDYGSGGGDWDKKINNTETFKSFLGLKKINKFEPALGLNNIKKSQCVLCFDVLEHIFISDIPHVLYEIFKYAKKLVVINVACYKAAALLPNNENAHITVRPPLWWKGCVDTVASNFPKIKYSFIASTEYQKAFIYPSTSHEKQINNDKFSALDL